LGILQDKVAIVTGAGRGIGRAIAERLTAEGARVVVNDMDEAPAKEVADAIGGPFQVGSVADPAVAEATVALAVDRFGRLDILVNNAGITRDVTIGRMTDAEWDLVLDVCLRGTFNFTRAAVPAFRQRFKDGAPGNGKIVNIASVNGLYGVAGNANYSAAKAGVIGLSKAAARELGRYHVNVNVIAPGYIAGTRLTSARDEESRLGMNPDLIAQVEKTIPIGRSGRPEDVAGVTVFLCSPDSDYVTGQVIEVHGGREIIEVAG
jgi:3-oxoacyl-[acyl-carrier protein] reductase